MGSCACSSLFLFLNSHMEFLCYLRFSLPLILIRNACCRLHFTGPWAACLNAGTGLFLLGLAAVCLIHLAAKGMNPVLAIECVSDWMIVHHDLLDLAFCFLGWLLGLLLGWCLEVLSGWSPIILFILLI